MQIAICDDEKEIRELLGDKVKNLYPEAALTFYAAGEELLASKERPDILFLDIQMPGKNGMETAEELRRKWRETVLIFVTALEEYVFQAFDVGAFHYLVKPVEEERLKEVLGRAMQEVNKRQGTPKCLLIKAGGVHRKIPVEDILYIENNGRKVVVHTKTEKLEYYERMNHLEDVLGEEFYRCHRGYLVALRAISGYDNASITVNTGEKIYLAKQKYAAFVKLYCRFLKE